MMKTISCSIIAFLFVCSPFLAFAQDDPAAAIASQDASDLRYTAEDFSALPDDEKKHIYLEEPSRLPENLDWDVYRPLFHEEN